LMEGTEKHIYGKIRGRKIKPRPRVRERERGLLLPPWGLRT
jgi:hypothetical protein